MTASKRTGTPTKPFLTALGLMSGTSMDGIDLGVLETDGETVRGTGPWSTQPYEEALRRRLGAAVMAPGSTPPGEIAALEHALTEAHAAAVRTFLGQSGLRPGDIDVIGFHGHTLLHRPEQRLTHQLGDGALLATRTATPVVNDFRSADVAAGGQGAPFVPLYHMALSRDLDRPLCVLNLGGVGNLTYIDGDEAVAFDTGPGNALIDDWVRRHTGRLYDADGRIAASGVPDGQRLARLLDHPYFSRRPPKSLDRNDFPLDIVEGLSLPDGAATLAAFTARSVARAKEHLPEAPRRWLVTGGGRHNPVIMAMLRDALAAPVDPVEAVGWQGDALEAQAFGFLAVRSLKGLPLSMPTTTGVPHPLTGGTHHPAGG